MEEFGDGLVESWRSKSEEPGWEPIKTHSRGSLLVEYSVDLKLCDILLEACRWIWFSDGRTVIGIRGDGGEMIIERLSGDSIYWSCSPLPAGQLPYCRLHILGINFPANLTESCLAMLRIIYLPIRTDSAPASSTRPAHINMFLRCSLYFISGVIWSGSGFVITTVRSG